jgi:hypothetical protein
MVIVDGNAAGGRMAKIDLKQLYPQLYAPSAKDFSYITVPPFNFLMIDGAGNPNTAPAYTEAVEALYAVAYSLRFTLKRQGIDYGVMPLEGLWWADDPAVFAAGERDAWRWTMMILQPEWVTPALVEAAVAASAAKKALPALSKLRCETYTEGDAIQIMYRGAYADEGPVLARMHAAIAAAGQRLTGKHHEIYLGDPRKTAPANLKTILRQPITASVP